MLGQASRRVPLLECVRYKRLKFKPKIAHTRPQKTASMLAMEHFDFYYAPVYGKQWPSIRLGLLTPNKYMAIVNTFSRSSEASELILEEIGAVDLIKELIGTIAIEKLEKKRKLMEAKALKQQEQDQSVKGMQSGEVEENAKTPEDLELEDLEMRGEAGLGEFRRSEETLTRSDLQLGRGRRDQRDAHEITMTGFEGQNIHLAKQSDFIVYPRSLKIYSMPRASLTDFPSPMKDDDGIPSWWLLDGSSVVPVLAMDIAEGDKVLDMCAAPGGKSLLAIQTQLPAMVVCNDHKLSRLGQLRRALSTYIPLDSKTAEHVILKRKDASNTKEWDELGIYDKVLLDAPCSTDRLSVNHDEGNMFSISMTTQRLNLPQLQTKLLINALRSVRSGGSVVYSTCSLSPIQNEVVVENAVAIARERFGIETVELTLEQLRGHLISTSLFRFCENIRRGLLVIPFLPSNFGPMYVCKLKRL